MHFITARDGKIKFTGNDKWFTYEDIEMKEVPSFYVPGFFVEEIDASNVYLLYEGFDNLCEFSTVLIVCMLHVKIYCICMKLE